MNKKANLYFPKIQKIHDIFETLNKDNFEQMQSVLENEWNYEEEVENKLD